MRALIMYLWIILVAGFYLWVRPDAGFFEIWWGDLSVLTLALFPMLRKMWRG